MLAAIFLIAVVTVLTAHYAWNRRRRSASDSPVRAPFPVTAVIDRLPRGIFLQETLTWSRVRSAGDVEIGVHPLVLSLAGKAARVSAPPAGARVERGQEFLTVRSGARALTVRSPVSGEVVARQEQDAAAADWAGMVTVRGQWSALVRPERLEDDLPSWLLGSHAREWTRARYLAMRDFLTAASPHAQTGVVLADGGELPVGALEELDDSGWQRFERRFLSTID